MKEINNEGFKMNRYLAQERKDWELFKKWQTRLEHTIICYPQKYGSVADVRIVDPFSCREKVAEIKQRNVAPETYPDCYIELTKWNNLMKLWRKEGIVSWYINFFDDDAIDVYLWVLPEIKEAKVYLNVDVNGNEVDRLGLSWKDAYHYHWNGYKYIPTEAQKDRLRKVPVDKCKLYTGDLDELQKYADKAVDELFAAQIE